MKNISSETTNIILNLEEKLLHADVRKSIETLDKILDNDFIENGSSGKVYTKSQVIEFLQNDSENQTTIQNFITKRLAANVVLATYKTETIDLSTGTKKISLRSSIWNFSDNRWQMVFHQGTPVSNI